LIAAVNDLIIGLQQVQALAVGAAKDDCSKLLASKKLIYRMVIEFEVEQFG
jgi:hypothetical protein